MPLSTTINIIILVMQQQTNQKPRSNTNSVSSSSSNYFIPLKEIITPCFKRIPCVFLTDNFEKILHTTNIYSKIMFQSKKLSAISSHFSSKDKKVLAVKNYSDSVALSLPVTAINCIYLQKYRCI